MCSVPLKAHWLMPGCRIRGAYFFIEPAWRIVYYQLATGGPTPIVTLPSDAMVGKPRPRALARGTLAVVWAEATVRVRHHACRTLPLRTNELCLRPLGQSGRR